MQVRWSFLERIPPLTDIPVQACIMCCSILQAEFRLFMWNHNSLGCWDLLQWVIYIVLLSNSTALTKCREPWMIRVNLGTFHSLSWVSECDHLFYATSLTDSGRLVISISASLDEGHTYYTRGDMVYAFLYISPFPCQICTFKEYLKRLHN